MVRQHLRQRLSSLTVGQKIGLGYALALGIAASGTSAGFGIGHHYQQQAKKQEDHARNEVELLYRLQSQILQTRTHQQQLIPLVLYPEKFQHEYAHLLKHEAQIQTNWAELKAFFASAPTLHDREFQTKTLTFLQTYDRVPQRYSKELKTLVERIRTQDFQKADVEQAEALLLEFTNSNLALEFDGISDNLVDLIDYSDQELKIALEAHESATKISEKIILVTIGLSVAAAILFAILTNRVIVQPIQALTRIARRSTEESNFDLQITVEQDDEIGTLANAFNQLIRSVQQLLQAQKTANEQLEIYSQTLESKVESRTQELHDKNTQLQQLLAELQRTQVHMVQSEKMSALGQMVAGIAHEINNPVNFIHGNLTHLQEYSQNLLDFIQLYQNHYPNPAPRIQVEAEDLGLQFIQTDLPKVLNSMKIGTDRIRQIVLSLRNFSRMDEADFKTADIHEGIDSTLLILQHRLNGSSKHPAIEVIRHYANLPPVDCYPGELNQALMNILVNAIDALEEVAVDQVQEIKNKSSQITIQTSMIDSQWINIVISDNGMGMPESTQKRVFDPFFTTKSVGKGTGMGMSISYQIITEKHGGKLSCVSSPSEGTEFTIQIPARSAAT